MIRGHKSPNILRNGVVRINRGFVRSDWKKNECSNMSKGQSTTVYRYLLALCVVIATATILASSLSFRLRMYISTLCKSQVSESLHVAQFPQHMRHQSRTILSMVSRTITSYPPKIERGLAIPDLCSEGTWTVTNLARHCEGRI